MTDQEQNLLDVLVFRYAQYLVDVVFVFARWKSYNNSCSSVTTAIQWGSTFCPGSRFHCG